MRPAKSAESKSWNLGAPTMPITDIPILAMLRERMQWQQARQQVLAENVANADTPDYRAKDLAPLDFSRALTAAALPLERTKSDHIAAVSNTGSQFASGGGGPYEVRPRGNAVSHEEEMMKVAANQMDYEAATEMYTHSLNLIKLAVKE
jgi:flagellar basal-body rod protein FlgB